TGHGDASTSMSQSGFNQPSRKLVAVDCLTTQPNEPFATIYPLHHSPVRLRLQDSLCGPLCDLPIAVSFAHAAMDLGNRTIALDRCQTAHNLGDFSEKRVSGKTHGPCISG